MNTIVPLSENDNIHYRTITGAKGEITIKPLTLK